AGFSGPVRLWDPATGKELRQLGESASGHGGHVAYSPDGTYLVRTAHGWLSILDPATGKRRHDASGPLWGFSPDGKRIATGGSGMTPKESVSISDSGTFKEVCKLEHGGTVLNAVFSADGKVVATGLRPWGGRAGDPHVFLWDAATGKRLHALKGSTLKGGGLCTLAFSPDGKVLAAAD